MRLDVPKGIKNYSSHPIAKKIPDLSFVYMLKMTGSNWLYVGSTFNVVYRLVGHNLGNTKTTRGWRPLSLMKAVAVPTRADAYALESQIHKSTKMKFEFAHNKCKSPLVLGWLSKDAVDLVNSIVPEWTKQAQEADINFHDYHELRDFLVSKDTLDLRYQIVAIGGVPKWAR